MKTFHNSFSQLNTPIIRFRCTFFIRRTTAGVQSMYAEVHRTTMLLLGSTLELLMSSLALCRTAFLLRGTTLPIRRTTLQLLMMYLQSFRTIFLQAKKYALLHRTQLQLRRTTLQNAGVFIDINNAYPQIFRNHIKVKFSFVEARLTLNSFGSASAIL